MKRIRRFLLWLLPARRVKIEAEDRPALFFDERDLAVIAMYEEEPEVCPKCGTASCLEDKAADW